MCFKDGQKYECSSTRHAMLGNPFVQSPTSRQTRNKKKKNKTQQQRDVLNRRFLTWNLENPLHLLNTKMGRALISLLKSQTKIKTKKPRKGRSLGIGKKNPPIVQQCKFFYVIHRRFCNILYSGQLHTFM